MNKIVQICSVGSALMISSTVMAAGPNTITFQGEVTSQTCEVTVNGNASNPVVLLPTVSTTVLTAAGSTAGETTFKLGVTGCDGTATNSNTKFVGNLVDADGNLGNATGTGYATNVALQLLTSSGGTAINLNDETSSTVPGVVLADGETEGSVEYAVQYYSNVGAATAGSVIGSVQYAVVYE
ncbi:fimbrial protein [Aeromonas salmonicida]|uniref:fimbrial protein n=1 Tax=Aeromonas salmonicida TaxID=645 RepID=UPI0022401D9E|nr:fimbrial protein [Aeromonas salmonicida]